MDLRQRRVRVFSHPDNQSQPQRFLPLIPETLLSQHRNLAVSKSR
jgi:hypothetical protein